MNLSKLFRERCETIAVEWRIKLNRYAFDPLPSSILLEEFGGKLVTPNDFENAIYPDIQLLGEKQDWSAILLHKDPPMILFNPLHSFTRHESNIMHEFGHLMLNHPMLRFSREQELPLRDPQMEAEATYLGGCLQIPRQGLLWATQRKYSLSQIAKHFGASEAMVLYRSKVTKVFISNI